MKVKRETDRQTDKQTDRQTTRVRNSQTDNRRQRKCLHRKHRARLEHT